MTDYVINRRVMDKRNDDKCLVRMVGKLEDEMGTIIFPGRFYPETAECVIQLEVTKPSTLDVLNIGSLRATDDTLLDGFLKYPENMDWLYTVADLDVPCLVDFRLKKKLTAKDFMFSFAPDTKGPSLFLSERNQVYSFDFEGWIATACNVAANQCFPVPDSKSITDTGKALLAGLTVNYHNLKQFTGTNGISFVKVPTGNPLRTTVEGGYGKGCITNLVEYAERNRDKFRPGEKQMPLLPEPTDYAISLLSITALGKEAYEDKLESSKLDPRKTYRIKLDTLLDTIFSAYIQNGMVHIVVYDAITVVLRDSLENIFETNQLSISLITEGNSPKGGAI
jgi:hypothetical protein